MVYYSLVHLLQEAANKQTGTNVLAYLKIIEQLFLKRKSKSASPASQLSISLT